MNKKARPSSWVKRNDHFWSSGRPIMTGPAYDSMATEESGKLVQPMLANACRQDSDSFRYRYEYSSTLLQALNSSSLITWLPRAPLEVKSCANKGRTALSARVRVEKIKKAVLWAFWAQGCWMRLFRRSACVILQPSTPKNPGTEKSQTRSLRTAHQARSGTDYATSPPQIRERDK